MLKKMILLGGVVNAFGVVFHVVIWKLLDWPDSLACLLDFNRSTMFVLNNHVLLTVLFFAVVSLFQSEEMLSTRFGQITSFFIGLFYAVRAVEQVLIYGEVTNIGLIIFILTLLTALLYWLPLAITLKNQS